MANPSIQVEDLGEAIAQELTLYHRNVTDGINAAGDKAIKNLVKRTRATAPVGKRSQFKKAIASKVLANRNGNKYVWFVRAPEYRLTHLLVHGHETRNGGRTRPDPFLKNALEEVLPEYEKEVEEAIKNGT